MPRIAEGCGITSSSMAGSFVSLCLLATLSLEVCLASKHECSQQSTDSPPIVENTDTASMLQTAARVPEQLHQNAFPYVRHEGQSCGAYESGINYIPQAGVSPAACKSQCDADPDCVSYHTTEKSPSNWPPHCIINKARCTSIGNHGWYVYYVKNFDRFVFSIFFNADSSQRMVTVGDSQKDFKDYINTCILPLAARHSKNFYACPHGNALNMYVEFGDPQQSASFQTFQWKPAAYWGILKAAVGTTFAGVGSDLKLLDKLSEHAFEAGIGCCTKIESGPCVP